MTVHNVSAIRAADYESAVAVAMDEDRWRILGWHEEIHDGITVDIIADHPDVPGITWYLECKGGTIPHRSGLARTDTTKKAIGTAWGLRGSQAIHGGRGLYWLVTSWMPHHGTVSDRLLRDAVRSGLVHGVGTIESLMAHRRFLAGDLPHGGFTMATLTGDTV